MCIRYTNVVVLVILVISTVFALFDIDFIVFKNIDIG